MNVVLQRNDALGDLLLTLPMIPALKKKYPEAKVSMIVSSRSYEAIKGSPIIESILLLDPQKKFLEKFIACWKFFREQKFTHYFYVGGEWLPSLMALLFFIRFRGGLIAKWHGFFFLNRGLRQKRSQVEMHEADYNLQLLSTLDVKEKITTANLLSLNDIEKMAAKKHLERTFNEQKKTFNEKYIVIHPGMTGHTLNWPSENYLKLISEIEKKLPNKFSFVISFTPSDKRYLTGLENEYKALKDDTLKNRICFFDGSTHGLRDYMGILNYATLFVGPSTGPLHLANLLGRKVIGIYSPIKVQSVHRWGPWFGEQKNCRAISPEVTCNETFECAKTACSYYECMPKISVTKVAKLVKEMAP